MRFCCLAAPCCRHAAIEYARAPSSAPLTLVSFRRVSVAHVQFLRQCGEFAQSRFASNFRLVLVRKHVGEADGPTCLTDVNRQHALLGKTGQELQGYIEQDSCFFELSSFWSRIK